MNTFSSSMLQRNSSKMVKLPAHRAGSFTVRKIGGKGRARGLRSRSDKPLFFLGCFLYKFY
ncbi:MAG: hypothetical protein D4R93_05820, partial [Deltaproteobacteria bacterium]